MPRGGGKRTGGGAAASSSAARSSKGKEKKAARKAAQEKQKSKAALVRRAMYLTPEEVEAAGLPSSTTKAPRNVLIPDFAALAKFDRDGLKCEIEFTTPASMDDATKAWIFDLTKANMKELYISAHWGWADAEKRKELMDDDARYFIAREHGSGKPVGLVHFRFMVECNAEVAYVYELQLEESARRKGLGRHLMTLVELAGRKHDMKWAMLTVFKENSAGLRFYLERMKYRIDEVSPSMNDMTRVYTYEILSKCLDPVLREADAKKFQSRNKLHVGRSTADEVLEQRSLLTDGSSGAADGSAANATTA